MNDYSDNYPTDIHSHITPEEIEEARSLDDSLKCITKLIERREAFALIVQPGKDLLDGTIFFNDVDICPWLTPFNDRITIGRRCRRRKVAPFPTETTPEGEYLQNAGKVVENCRKRSGKTVVSCVWTHKTKSGESRVYWPSIIYDLFRDYSESFRYFFYHPMTGFWVGSTPEVLIDFNKRTGEFSTMALAGTRSNPDRLEGFNEEELREYCGEWSEKDQEENQFVVRYITEKLANLGIATEVEEATVVKHAMVEHICHVIRGKADPSMLPQIIDAINPTAALCGYPKEEALADIAMAERHERGCYGGFLGIDSEERYTAHVILRCIRFTRDQWALYAGSGLTADSDPYDESLEIVDKVMPHLLSLGLE